MVNQHGQASQPTSTATQTSNQKLSVLCINLTVLSWLPWKLAPQLEHTSMLQWELTVACWAERNCSILGEPENKLSAEQSTIIQKEGRRQEGED